MAPSNAALLTRQSTAWAHKKRARQGQVKEVVFDEEARRDYLTGFRKRNVEKKKAAKAKAVKREKEEHLQERRQMREELKERARTNFEAVEKAYGGAGISIDDFSSKPSANEHEEEYSDEEQLATVAVVEDFDPAADMHGPLAERAEGGDGDEVEETLPGPSKGKGRAKSTDTKKLKAGALRKTKPPVRKIRYETKAAARAEHAKTIIQRRKQKDKRIEERRSKRPSKSRKR